MDPAELQRHFAETLEDRRLSRGERQALKAVLEDLDPSTSARLELVRRAFDTLREALSSSSDRELLDWLERLMKLLWPRDVTAPAEAFFAPRQDCAGRLRQLFEEAERTVEICVFTITDDSLTRAILGAHQRGVAVRIVTDDEKSWDRGSDIHELAAQRIPVRIDASSDHMHHKFAIFDRQQVVTGSYNWTRGASSGNQENLLVTGDRRLLTAYSEEFERLWAKFAVRS